MRIHRLFCENAVNFFLSGCDFPGDAWIVNSSRHCPDRFGAIGIIGSEMPRYRRCRRKRGEQRRLGCLFHYLTALTRQFLEAHDTLVV